MTTASVAGARYGHTLLWALLFSVAATMVLQEMAARLGVVTRAGLGEALTRTFRRPLYRWPVVGLVLSAIVFGNGAFETGNISGAAAALEMLSGNGHAGWAAAVGCLAAGLLLLGSYRWIERFLVALVGLMSLAFAITVVLLKPDLRAMSAGLVPRMPSGSELSVIALIGTTVVPYNLFLHASAVCEKWRASDPVDVALGQARVDAHWSITIGGLMTLAIYLSAATCWAVGTEIESAAEMANQLEPLLGASAKWCFAVGLFAAGLTSAVTAPLAAAYAARGTLGWGDSPADWRFRTVWAVIVVSGTVLAMTGTRPVDAIVFAQAANGMLLPVVAVFLLVVVNRKALLGRFVNGAVANALGLAVVLVVSALGGFKLVTACR